MADDVRSLASDAFARFNDAADREAFFEAYDDGVVLHGYPADLQGIEGLRAFHTALWEAFPDAQLTVEDLVVDEDRAALRYRLRGTHRGAYLGVAPTGAAARGGRCPPRPRRPAPHRAGAGSPARAGCAIPRRPGRPRGAAA